MMEKQGEKVSMKCHKPTGVDRTIGIILGLFLFLGLTPLPSRAEGSLLAFVRGGNIWIADSHGGGARQLTSQGQAESPSLSRDGSRVAFTGSDVKGRAVYLIATDGGSPQRLNLAGIGDAWSPAFTPDGQGLAVVTRFNIQKRQAGPYIEERATHAVSLVDLATGQIRHLIKAPNHPIDFGDVYDRPTVSPDGRLVAYQESYTDVSGGFVILTLEGKQVFRFPKDPEKDYRPFWRPSFSPDGGKVLCFSMPIREGEKSWIYLVDLKSGQASRIVEGYYPTFVEGGRAIVFERWTGTDKYGNPGKIDLWRLDLTPGTTPRLILHNAEKPAGSG
jgi:Tol biopolymer transport system component